MVAVGGAGRPVGLLGRDGGADRLPRVHLFEREIALDGGQSRLVGEDPANGDVALAVRGELGPVAGDRRVEVELAALHQPVDAHGRDALGGGEHERDGVALPGARLVAVGEPAPEVDHRLALEVDAARRPHLVVLGEVALEGVPDPLEAGRYVSTDRIGHAAMLPVRECAR